VVTGSAGCVVSGVGGVDGRPGAGVVTGEGHGEGGPLHQGLSVDLPGDDDGCGEVAVLVVTELYVVDVAHGDALVRSSCALDVERLVGVGEAGGDLCRPILVGETAGLCEDRCHGRLDRGGDLAVAEAGQRQRGRLGRGGEVDVGDLPGRVLGDDAFIVLGDLHQVEGRDRVCAVTHRDLGSLRLADRGPGEGCGDAAIAGGEGGEHRRGCERGEVP